MRVHCPFCKKKKLDIVSNGVWDTKDRSVYKCQKCGIVFLHPMMTEKEAEKFYSDVGAKARLKRIPHKKKKLFLESKQMNSAKRQVRLLRKYLQPSFTFCEIGASNGLFLINAKKYVRRVIAVEAGRQERENLESKNLEHYPLLRDIREKDLKFNAVAMFHLFEHLSDPEQYLKILTRFLKKGSLVFVEVPNVDDVLVSRYNLPPFRKFYFQSMHCFYYNHETLTRVFARCGFKLVKCHFIQRYPFSNHLQWLLQGTAGGNEFYERQFYSINKKYADILIKEKISDTILCVFKKV